MLLFVTVENKKISKRKPNWTDREKVVLLEEYAKRKVILKAKFSSSMTSGGKNKAWQEIANIENPRNSVKRDIKEIQNNGTIYVLPQKLRFLYIVGAKNKQVIDNLYIKKKYNCRIAQNGTIVFQHWNS
jgi:hypothetical protein